MLAPDDPDGDLARRRRIRADDTARWRSRKRRGVELFQFEAGSTEYDLAVWFGGLKETQRSNKAAVNRALGQFLRRAIAALLREEARRP